MLSPDRAEEKALKRHKIEEGKEEEFFKEYLYIMEEYLVGGALLACTGSGEAIGEGELAWHVVSNVIMNRVGQWEWFKLNTPSEVMNQKNQFSCLNDGGNPKYLKAVNYLNNRV